MQMSSVLLADDHTIVIEGLRRVLEPHFEVVGTAADGVDLVAIAQRLRPDVIVADISMPLLSGIEAVRRIRATNRFVKVVFLTMHPDVIYVSEAFLAGASGYVLKSSAGSEILTAVREALGGRRYITATIDRAAVDAQIQRDLSSRDPFPGVPPRQREVVRMVAEGRSTKQIAEILAISARTVEFHRYRAMKSLGVHSVAELVQWAIKHRLIQP
jgi:DNA-binding NarL/FixJ family response regulator